MYKTFSIGKCVLNLLKQPFLYPLPPEHSAPSYKLVEVGKKKLVPKVLVNISLLFLEKKKWRLFFKKCRHEGK